MEEKVVHKCTAQEFILGEGSDGNDYLWRLLWEIDVINMETRWNSAEFFEGPKEMRKWIVPSTLLFGAVRRRLLRGDPVPEDVFNLVGEIVNRGVRQYWASIFKVEGTEEVDFCFAGLVENDAY